MHIIEQQEAPMATIAITPDQDAVTAEIFIAAPPQRVFQAITDPAQLPRWWGQKDMYRITESNIDLRPGGKWSSIGVGADGTKFRVDGEYLEVDPPRLLVHTWVPSYSELPQTVVRWELEASDVQGLRQSGPHRIGTGTRLKLRHYGFAGNTKSATEHGQGWTRVLGWMQAFVEGGATAESRP
jgi:uncharacterized protein YndB with AHSA1/START domain